MTGENPLVAPRVDSTTAYSGIGIVESAVDVYQGVESGSWVQGGIGTAGGGLEMLGLITDPVGTLMSYAVAWLMEHVKPLSDALDWLAGDPDSIASFAQTWRNVAGAMEGASSNLDSAVSSQLTQWTGVAAQAYRTFAQAQSQQLRAAGTGSQTIASITQGAGVLVGAVREIVRDLIAQCVSTLIARIPTWLAMIAGTLGGGLPACISQAVTMISQWVNRIGQFLRSLTQSLNNLIPLIRQLDDVFGGVSDALRRGPSGGTGPGSPSAGGSSPQVSTIGAPETGAPTGTPGTVTTGQAGPGASRVSDTPTAAPGTVTTGQAGPGASQVSDTPTATPGTTAAPTGTQSAPAPVSTAPTAMPGTTAAPTGTQSAPAPVAPTPTATPGTRTPTATAPASTAPASAAPSVPATTPTPGGPSGGAPTGGSGGLPPGGTPPGGTPPGGPRPGGGSTPPPPIVRRDGDFGSDVNHKGIRKSHLDADGNLVPANPDGRTTVTEHVQGNRDPEAKGNSPYTSFGTDGAKLFGDQELSLDVARLQDDIAAGRVQGVEVLNPQQVQASIQADIDATAGRPVQVTLDPTDYTRSDILDFARNELGMSNSQARAIAPQIEALLNAQLHKEWLVKGTVPAEYLSGPRTP